MKNRSIFLWLCLAAFFFIGSSFLGYAINSADEEEPELTSKKDVTDVTSMIEPYNIVFLERYALCDEYNLNCKANGYDYDSIEDLQNLSEEEIRALFPAPDWSVFLDDRDLTITHLLEGLCPEHKKTMHLGLNQSGEYVTICYGPSEISSLGGVYLVSDIPFAALNDEQKDKIIHGSYESQNLEELQGILDSLGEIN